MGRVLGELSQQLLEEAAAAMEASSAVDVAFPGQAYQKVPSTELPSMATESTARGPDSLSGTMRSQGPAVGAAEAHSSTPKSAAENGWSPSGEDARVAELQGLCARLSARAADLEAPAARAADLERVAETLRVRVSDLEMQEARIDRLRSECGALRMRVAELVASAVQTEEEHKQLCVQVGQLEHLREPLAPCDAALLPAKGVA